MVYQVSFDKYLQKKSIVYGSVRMLGVNRFYTIKRNVGFLWQRRQYSCENHVTSYLQLFVLIILYIHSYLIHSD